MDAFEGYDNQCGYSIKKINTKIKNLENVTGGK